MVCALSVHREKNHPLEARIGDINKQVFRAGVSCSDFFCLPAKGSLLKGHAAGLPDKYMAQCAPLVL